MSTVEVYVDDVLTETISGSVTRRFNGPSSGEIIVPLPVAHGDIGTSKARFYLDGTLALHARCTEWELTADVNTGYLKMGFTDPIEIWDKRLVMDSTGDFSKPTVIEDEQTAPQIVERMLIETEARDGDMEIELGTFAAGGPSMEGAPTDWPMTIAELTGLLIGTGQLDVVAVPIEGGSDLVRVDAYNGDYGSDLTGSVALEFATGTRSASAMRWAKKMDEVVNKLWYYLGPRVATELDPAGDQHWRANITGDDSGLPGFPGAPYSTVIARRNQSRLDYLVRMMVQIFDGIGDEAIVARELYRWRWLAEQWARAIPHELFHLTAQRGFFAYGDFGEGDLITVAAGTEILGGFTGAQRVFAYTAAWDKDSVLAITDLQSSPGNEGLT